MLYVIYIHIFYTYEKKVRSTSVPSSQGRRGGDLEPVRDEADTAGSL